MNELLENDYFNWLCSKVVDSRKVAPDRLLLSTLYRTEFVWLVIGDDNRAADGRDLRGKFLREMGEENDDTWRNELECSVLEMLIAFSQRAEWMTDQPAVNWFWEFIENLGLSDDRRSYNISEAEIREALDVFMWRRYDYNGRGGLFPIRDAAHDQRKVELWYQITYYLQDQDRLP
jgi:hypothetical protein